MVDYVCVNMKKIKKPGQKDYKSRITESENQRLEKMSKIIKSNHHTNITMPTKPYPEVPHLHIF